MWLHKYNLKSLKNCTMSTIGFNMAVTCYVTPQFSGKPYMPTKVQKIAFEASKRFKCNNCLPLEWRRGQNGRSISQFDNWSTVAQKRSTQMVSIVPSLKQIYVIIFIRSRINEEEWLGGYTTTFWVKPQNGEPWSGARLKYLESPLLASWGIPKLKSRHRFMCFDQTELVSTRAIERSEFEFILQTVAGLY